MSNYNPFKSVIFNKVIMAATGGILVLFLIGHAAGNLQVFLGQEAYNKYSHFLQSTGELLWIVRLVLIVSILLHIITSLKLKAINMAAKPEGYNVKRFVKATVYSRTMLYTGILIALFATYHLMHYTVRNTNPEFKDYHEYYNPSGMSFEEMQSMHGMPPLFKRHDTYRMVVKGFSDPLVSGIYILAVLFLGFHLAHAIQSMFQTLGWGGPKLTPQLMICSKFIGFGLTVAFAAVPIAILFFGLGKGVL